MGNHSELAIFIFFLNQGYVNIVVIQISAQQEKVVYKNEFCLLDDIVRG